ncbi:MAG TPA: TetR family transcriptional regulator [Solirubrobacteraceae bacterium]|jgi:AcrR family transcriptional regulator|nr:TetR family transcriptional regulator [Solirubrobacteraceae bacterium]
MSVVRRRPASIPARRGGSIAVSELQRARMLRSAVAVVSEHGYGHMSVARITDRARVSRRTFYEIFTDREDCFLAVFDDVLGQAAESVVGSYERERGWLEQVRAGLAALLAFLDERPEVASLLIIDALGAGPRVLRRRADVMARLGATLDAGGARAKGTGRPPELTGEGLVGAVFSVIHTRLQAKRPGPLLELLGPLMGMIALPYRGAAAARRELRGTRASSSGGKDPAAVRDPQPLADPLAGLPMRLTYRTLRVLGAVAESPGASNREIAERAGVADAGQISKLLARLDRLGLICNGGRGHSHGESNAWALTALGRRVAQRLGAAPRTEDRAV